MKIQQWLFELLRKQSVTDGRTHGRTDGRTHGQRENSIPPTNKVCGGIKMILLQIIGQCDTYFDLCDLYFMVEWFCPKSGRPSDIRMILCQRMRQWNTYFDLCDVYFMVEWFCPKYGRPSDIQMILFQIMRQWNMYFDLCDVYFMVEWFCPISGRPSDKRMIFSWWSNVTRTNIIFLYSTWQMFKDLSLTPANHKCTDLLGAIDVEKCISLPFKFTKTRNETKSLLLVLFQPSQVVT